MNDSGCLTLFLAVWLSFMLFASYFDRQSDEEKAHKYEVVCGSLNDCCRNMIDAYDLPDSIYNHYLDVIEEQGFDKKEIKNLYYSY